MKKIEVKELEVGESWFAGKVFCFSKEFYDRFRKQMRKESDRGCVLIVSGIIDSILKKRLLKKCTQGNVASREKLFTVGGPFHSFAPKLEWLFCTNELSRSLRDDLHIVRRLRNQCAHNWEDFVFDKNIENLFLVRMNVYSWIKSTKDFILSKEEKQMTHVVEIEPRLQFIFLASILISTLNAVNLKSVESIEVHSTKINSANRCVPAD
jgi:hypothetical protein